MLTFFPFSSCITQPSSSSGTHQEPMMRISDADINISRQRFSILLSRYTAYELLPDSGKVRILAYESSCCFCLVIILLLDLNVYAVWNVMYFLGLCPWCWSAHETRISYHVWAGNTFLLHFFSFNCCKTKSFSSSVILINNSSYLFFLRYSVL